MNIQAKIKDKVSERYAAGAMQRQEALCCPVDYDKELLKILLQEIIDRDYGCGDRVSFRKGYIQDLALEVEAAEHHLCAHPVKSVADLQSFETRKSRQRAERPLIADNSIDLVVSNCVLNLVAEADRKQMLSEIFRVFKPGGRVAISDIVSGEFVPAHLRADADLWTGCISGAFQEKEFADAFLAAGLILVKYDKWDDKPWQVVEGIEFRPVTLMAVKPSPQVCLDTGQAVIHTRPFSGVRDDEDHVYPRGVRIAVCERTYQFLTQGPLKEHFIGINPPTPKAAVTFCAPAGTIRPASETKGASHAACNPEGACC